MPSVIKEDVIKCGDCGTRLMNLVVTETNEDRIKKGLKPIISKYRVRDCYNCGGSSFFSKEFEGTVSVAPFKESVKLVHAETIQNFIERDKVTYSIISNILSIGKQ